jgi:cyclase
VFRFVGRRKPFCATFTDYCLLAEVQRITPDVSVLIGTSSNVLILNSPAGVLLVDDQRASDAAETQAAVNQAAHAPVRYVVDTHWHLDHCGGNEVFAAAGATIVAQRNVRVRRSSDQFMVEYNKHIPAAPAAALPSLLFDRRLKLRLGSETVILHHLPHAHTDGDVIVKVRQANVLHMGDIFFNGIFPFIDRSSGGSIQGLLRAVDAALAMADGNTRIVPGHGAIAGKADLIAYRTMLNDIAARVRSEMKVGRSLAEIVAADPAAAYRGRMQGNADRLVTAIYDSYSGKP